MTQNDHLRKTAAIAALAILVSGVLLAPALLQPAYAANTLTVRAYTTGGDALGMYAVIKSGSTTVKSGFTPLTYTGTTDKTYTVQVYNYQDLTFSYWGGGSGSSNPRTLTLWGDTTVVAYYNKGSTSSTRDLTVNAYTTGGEALNMYAVIKSGSTTAKSGFTPLTYAGTLDKTYTVQVYNYQDLTFSYWGGGSGSSNPRTLTLSADTTATAYYTKGTTSSTTTSSSSSTSIGTLIPKTGVLVSLYMYPGSTGSTHWQKVIDEKKEHPSVPIVAIFNPSSGPGSSKSSTIANWVDKLQDAGVIAIGYVHDDYGSKSLSSLKADADKYRNWYGADGLFIDEFTNKKGYESHYKDLKNYAKSIGMKLTVGNPGTDVPPSYIGSVDVINTSEGRGYISLTDPNLIGSSWVGGGYTGWHKDYDKRNFSVVRYDSTWLNTTFVSGARNLVGLMYITDGNDSNSRWFHVPPYFGDLVAALDK